ncbi:carbon-nitrogen hydrolase [Xylariaceae sp. FL1019]|nr:carbon-nitrogen hydrolase [Xylariaceae sp. FL1019]
MRIGCLQFAPEVSDRNNNLNRADAILSKANPENLDLLVLPELAFTGYNFKSLHHINPCLELKGSGISALWARSVALRFNCVVTVGYPEKIDVRLRWPTSPEYYNSVIVVNPDGETIGNYRKSFLYYTDQTWALEGPDGFYGGSLPGLGKTAMGISPWNAFEFAFHCLQVEANLVILTMAWLTREDAQTFSSMPHEPDMDTLTYWLTRLEPIIRSESRDEIIVVFCNRTGVEDDAVYAGTSTVLGIKDGEVSVYGILGRGESELLVVDTDAEPYAKLVYGSIDPGSAIASAVGSVQEPENSDLDESRAIEDENPLTTEPPSNVDSENCARQNRSLIRRRIRASTPAQTEHHIPVDVGEDFSYVPLGLGHRAASDTYSSSNIDQALPTPTAPSPTPLDVRPDVLSPKNLSGQAGPARRSVTPSKKSDVT